MTLLNDSCLEKGGFEVFLKNLSQQRYNNKILNDRQVCSMKKKKILFVIGCVEKQNQNFKTKYLWQPLFKKEYTCST